MPQDLNISMDAEGLRLGTSRLPLPPTLNSFTQVLGSAYRVEEDSAHGDKWREYIWDDLGLRASIEMSGQVRNFAVTLQRIESPLSPKEVYDGAIVVAGVTRLQGESPTAFMKRIVAKSAYKGTDNITEGYGSYSFGPANAHTHRIVINQISSEIGPFISYSRTIVPDSMATLTPTLQARSAEASGMDLSRIATSIEKALDRQTNAIKSTRRPAPFSDQLQRNVADSLYKRKGFLLVVLSMAAIVALSRCQRQDMNAPDILLPSGGSSPPTVAPQR